MTIVYRSISVTDLEQAGFQILLSSKSSTTESSLKVERVFKDGEVVSLDTFYQGLYFLGLQLNKLLILEPQCHHVRLDGTETDNYRFTGQERSDKEWLHSGYASEEAILSSSKMKDMVKGGMQMQKGGDRSSV